MREWWNGGLWESWCVGVAVVVNEQSQLQLLCIYLSSCKTIHDLPFNACLNLLVIRIAKDVIRPVDIDDDGSHEKCRRNEESNFRPFW